MICGTYLHGIFHNFEFRRSFTDVLRENKGLEKLGMGNDDFKDSKRVNYNQLGDLFADNVDMDFINNLLKN